VGVPRVGPSTRGGKAVSYSVLRITDHNGVVHYDAVETVLVKDRQAQVQQAYLKAAREWKPGQNPAAPGQQPLKPDVRVWRTVMGGPDARERAEAIAVQCRKAEEDGKKPDDNSSTDPDTGSGKTPGAPLSSTPKIPGPLVK